MVRFTQSIVAALAGLAGLASAHPGHDHKTEAAERAAFLRSAPVQGRSLNHCAQKLKARGVSDSNIARRESTVQQLRKRQGSVPDAPYLKARNLDSVLATDHESTKDVTLSTDPSILFADGGACIVQPEVTQGPYYIAGELVRRDMTEDQEGVPLFLDIQLVDVNTCEPLTQTYTDIWHCNATGVYSGVVASENGNINDEGNLNTTFLRGIQQSDDEGVVRFETIFPGHYVGRATHIHVVSYSSDQIHVLPNGTLSNTYDTHSSHVGQIFFDQNLISTVEQSSPYSTNTQELTTNDEDSILETEADTTDPFVEYVFLDEDVSKGVFAWISIGVNGTRNDYASPEGWWTENGGVQNDDFEINMAGMGDLQVPTGSASVSAAPTSA